MPALVEGKDVLLKPSLAGLRLIIEDALREGRARVSKPSGARAGAANTNLPRAVGPSVF